MCHPSALLRLGLALYLLAFSLSAHALVVVRMETVLGDIDIELYDDIAPLTVANFLAYANGGDYDGTFIHRSVPGFIIQGGGHFLNDGTREHIPERAPVPNEFNLSNIRGTLAMAKLPGDPDSATSEWFFNLADNSGNLDFQNGGFTVFGRVLGDGMDVVDAIAALQVINAGGVYGDLPVRDYAGGDLVDANYVIVTRVFERRLMAAPEVDFGAVGLGWNSEREVTVVNHNLTVVTLGDVAGIDGVDLPFGIISDGCSGQELIAGADCVIRLAFEPTVLGLVEDSFNIPSNDANYPNIHVLLRGTGSLPLRTVPESGLSMGEVVVGESAQHLIAVNHVGGPDVLVTGISIDGVNADEFFQQHDCSLLVQGGSCEVTVTFTPASIGDKQASLIIQTNSAGQEQIEISLTGKGRDQLLPNLEVSATAFAFRDSLLGLISTRFLFMMNSGEADFLIDSISIIGADAGEFSFTNSCGDVLIVDDACSLTISFLPVSEGAKSATLVIASAHSGVPDLEIDLSGFGRESWVRVELDAPNGGRIVLRSPPGTRLQDVAMVEGLAESGMPSGIAFKDGFIRFTLALPAGVSQGAVLVSFPADELPKTYYKFGRTPDDATPHWYEFMWDEETQTGAFVSEDENVVILYLRDGARGDDDLIVNGLIVDPGGPGYAIASTPIAPEPSGGGGCVLSVHSRSPWSFMDWVLVSLFVGFLGLRCRQRGSYCRRKWYT